MKNRILKIFTELCRHHISALLAVTLIDMALARAGSFTTICFSLLLPQRLLVGGEAAFLTTDMLSFRIYSWLLIAVCFALFVLCIVFSYRRPGWLICAAVMTLLDISVAVWFIISKHDASYYVDIAVHSWIIIALIAGYILQRVSSRPAKPTSDIAANAPVQAIPAADATIGMTGLVFAMEDEALQVLSHYELDKKEVMGHTVYSREGVGITAIIAGMGKVSAQVATSILIHLGCDRIVNIGTCGCTNGKYAPGSLVIPNVFYDGDFDLSMLDITSKDPAGVNTVEVEVPVPCYTYSTFVTDDRAPDGIVEMEAYAVVAQCRAFGVPVTVIKIVSDGGNVDEFEGNVDSVITRHLDEIKQIIEA
ncbi:MAG: hypothetical protein IJY27_01585 [Clostridia bacterium]|nr:hypothetical protein [Clostridia bacterium]